MQHCSCGSRFGFCPILNSCLGLLGGFVEDLQWKGISSWTKQRQRSHFLFQNDARVPSCQLRLSEVLRLGLMSWDVALPAGLGSDSLDSGSGSVSLRGNWDVARLGAVGQSLQFFFQEWRGGILPKRSKQSLPRAIASSGG